MNPVMFREYDIRGIVGIDITDEFAYNLGRAYYSLFVSRNKNTNPLITVGHDARISSPNLKEMIIKGLNDSGADTLDLGLITTPISYFSTFTVDKVEGSIMITGSHNPPDYNGFKISVGKGTIFGESIQEIRRIMENSDYKTGSGSNSKYDILPSYIERYKNEFGNLGGIPVVFDCGNGAAGCIARRLFESVGIETKILFEEPDGTFPNHHPDPTVEKNLVDLKDQVKESNSWLGIGFDGDADRIGVVDDTGRTILGDELMVIFSRSILKLKSGEKIVGDVKCSDRMYNDVREKGGEPIMWQTGHSLIKNKIKEEKAPFGGELSGHLFFADRNYGTDDALYAGLRLIEIMKKTGKKINELLEGLPPSFNTPEIRIDTTEEKKKTIVEDLVKEFGNPTDDYKVNLIDGIRISYKDGWALARASNTQPVLVLRFESNTPEGLERIKGKIQSFVEERL